MTSWFGNLTVQSKAQISSLVRTAGEIMGTPAPLNPQELFEQAISRQARSILSDKTHVLYPEYRLMNSGRRFRVPLYRYNRYKYNCIQLSVTFLNDQKGMYSENVCVWWGWGGGGGGLGWECYLHKFTWLNCTTLLVFCLYMFKM